MWLYNYMHNPLTINPVEVENPECSAAERGFGTDNGATGRHEMLNVHFLNIDFTDF